MFLKPDGFPQLVKTVVSSAWYSFQDYDTLYLCMQTETQKHSDKHKGGVNSP